MHRKLVSKRNYQYLGLLGISLFSLSLSQLNPVNAHADTTSEQTQVIADSSSQSSKPTSGNSSNGESTSQSNLKDSSNGSDNGLRTDPGSSAQNVQSNNSKENAGTDNVQASKLPISNTKTLKKNNLIKSDAPTPSTAVTPSDSTPSNLVVIKNGDSSVQLDNKLKLSVDQAPTLGKVTATNPDNFTYDEGTQTAIITDPTATDAVMAEYKNVGTYQGKAISAQVTIANILKHTDEHPVPNSSLTADQIQLTFMPYFEGGIKTYNVGQDEVTIKFFDEAGNQVAINGDGYITVGSLNGPSTSTAGNEYINYGNGSTSTYVTEDSAVKYQTNPLTGSGNAYVGVTNDFKDVLGAPTSENGAVTFQLAGNAFTFLSGTTRYTLKNANHHWSYTLTTFSSATVAPAVIPAPVLTVDKSSAKARDTVNYTLNQQVNVLGEDTMLRYQSWSEVVTLPTEVSYQQASLLDSTGAVIPSATFTWDAKTRQLTVTLPEDYLQNTMVLNGETYQIRIGTTVNNGVANGEVGPASGQVTINNGAKASNGVSTFYVAPVVSASVTMSTMIVHYYKKGTTEKLVPDQNFEVAEGQRYVAPESGVKGYKVSSQFNTDEIYNGQSEAVYFYERNIYKLTVNYVIDLDKSDKAAQFALDVDGAVWEKRKINIKYGSAYKAPILDLSDDGLYVIQKELPKKLKGVMGDNDLTINIYYGNLKNRSILNKKTGTITRYSTDPNGVLRYIEQDEVSDSVLILSMSSNQKKISLTVIDMKSGAHVSSYQFDEGEEQIIRLSNGEKRIVLVKNGTLFDKGYAQASLNSLTKKTPVEKHKDRIVSLTNNKVKLTHMRVENKDSKNSKLKYLPQTSDSKSEKVTFWGILLGISSCVLTAIRRLKRKEI